MAVALTTDQRKFLNHHGIATERVFDASGLRPAEYRVRMKEQGFLVAVGVTVCLNGHELRSRHGKCVICRPETLVFSGRFHEDQHVYVAHSKAGKLIKIGTSGDLADRFEQMNIHQYGGFADWVMLESVYCTNAGRLEKDVQALLVRYQVRGAYGARPEYCRELFQCQPAVALRAFRRAQQA